MSGNVSGPESVSSKGDGERAQPPPAEARRAELPILEVGGGSGGVGGGVGGGGGGGGGSGVRERADAARNRLRVLAAAERLFAERGVAGVTMDDVAAAAGVGKGTLYRRFTDKSGLAIALLDDRERDLQERILSGPPPLGPGTEPTERLVAFVASYLEFLDRRLDLVHLAETSTPGARLRTGVHGFWRLHCTYLLREAGAPHPGLRADVLLAGLAAEQVRHWLRDERRPVAALAEGLSSTALALARR